MAELSPNQEAKHPFAGSDLRVDLSDMEPLSTHNPVNLRDIPHSSLQELNRGAIGHTAVKTAAGLFLLLPVLGGLVAVFGSPEQAEAFTSSVVTILKALAELAPWAVWPIFGYYFMRNAK